MANPQREVRKDGGYWLPFPRKWDNIPSYAGLVLQIRLEFLRSLRGMSGTLTLRGRMEKGRETRIQNAPRRITVSYDDNRKRW